MNWDSTPGQDDVGYLCAAGLVALVSVGVMGLASMFSGKDMPEQLKEDGVTYEKVLGDDEIPNLSIYKRDLNR